MVFKAPGSQALFMFFKLSDMFTSQRLCPVLPFTKIFSPVVLRPQGVFIPEATLTHQPGPGLIGFHKSSPSFFLIFQLRNAHTSQLFAKQR